MYVNDIVLVSMIVNFEYTWHLILMFLLLALHK